MNSNIRNLLMLLNMALLLTSCTSLRNASTTLADNHSPDIESGSKGQNPGVGTLWKERDWTLVDKSVYLCEKR